MKREEIERLRKNVGCPAVLETSGFALDIKESTRRSRKYRRASEIIIVTHGGQGWFDPLSEEKGDVFGLMTYLERCDFPDSCARIAALVGFQPSEPPWRKGGRKRTSQSSTAGDWERRRSPWPGSATWRYLRWERCLPVSIIRTAIAQEALREGPYGSMWAAHVDAAGMVAGWECRGPQWRGFSAGGAKTLFRLGAGNARRLCVTEAAIDAMSLAAIEKIREGTLYLSTGGGWSPNTDEALRRLTRRSDVQLFAATDANPQGEAYAHRLRELAEEVGCSWSRLRPPADDWNDVLKHQEMQRREREKEKNGVPHSRRPHQGRLRPVLPALDPDGHDAGGPGDVMED